MAGRSAKTAGGGGEGAGETKRSGKATRDGKDDVASTQAKDLRTKAKIEGESEAAIKTTGKDTASEDVEGQGKGKSEGAGEARLKGSVVGKGLAKGEARLKSESTLVATGAAKSKSEGKVGFSEHVEGVAEGEDGGGVSAVRERFWRTSALGRPKRSAFFNFMEGIRTRLPGQSPREIARRAPTLWRELSAEEKQPYLDMAEQARRLPPLPDGKSSTSYVTVHLDKEAWSERMRRSAARGGVGVGAAGGGGRAGTSAERLHGAARRPPAATAAAAAAAAVARPFAQFQPRAR